MNWINEFDYVLFKYVIFVLFHRMVPREKVNFIPEFVLRPGDVLWKMLDRSCGKLLCLEEENNEIFLLNNERFACATWPL